MKTVVALVLIICSNPLQAACKCNCNLTDVSICASNYDLDNPCTGVCPTQSTVTIPMRTACPLTQVFNPITGAKEWRAICED
jgi:hypothetical protein